LHSCVAALYCIAWRCLGVLYRMALRCMAALYRMALHCMAALYCCAALHYFQQPRATKHTLAAPAVVLAGAGRGYGPLLTSSTTAADSAPIAAVGSVVVVERRRG
jgi:hypothetical protein